MTLTINVPEEVLSAVGRSADEAERDARLALAIEWYRRGAVTQGKAAEIAGVPRADFIDELSSRKIEVVQVSPEELRREILLG
jgi:predicted HTH domain antitoxin